MFRKLFHLPVQFRQIEEDGFHLTVRCRVNGKSCTLLVDTGASRTVFDNTRIRNFVGDQKLDPNEKLSSGLGTNSMETQTTILNKLKFGDLLVEHFTTVLLDLSHVNETYVKMGFAPIDGVLGSDILMQYQATLDYRKKELLLRRS